MPWRQSRSDTGLGPGDCSGQGGSSGSISAHNSSSTIHGRVLTPSRTAESSHRSRQTSTIQQDRVTSSIGVAGKQIVASSCRTRCSGVGRPEGTEDLLTAKFQVLLPHLDERQRRLAIGAEALSLGNGGIRLVAAAAGVRESTVSRGVVELESGRVLLGRVRRPGGGRKRAADLDPELRPALLALVEPDERGDPMLLLRWTTKSTRKLAAALTWQGHRVSADTVAGLLREEGFQSAGQRQDRRRCSALRQGRPVPLPQRAGTRPQGRR